MNRKIALTIALAVALAMLLAARYWTDGAIAPSRTVASFWSCHTKTRSTRREFLWSYLLRAFADGIVILLIVVWALLGNPRTGDVDTVMLTVHCVSVWPMLCVSIRRCHDIGLSGWWVLLLLVELLDFTGGGIGYWSSVILAGALSCLPPDMCDRSWRYDDELHEDPDGSYSAVDWTLLLAAAGGAVFLAVGLFVKASA